MRILKKLIRTALHRLKATLRRMPRTKRLVKRLFNIGLAGKSEQSILKSNIAFEETLLLELVHNHISLSNELYPNTLVPLDESTNIGLHKVENIDALKSPKNSRQARAYLKQLRELTKTITRENYLLLLEKQRLTKRA
jgi:hypothetical protein